MSMTLTEKILAKKAGLSEVRPGDVVSVRCDLVMANDATMRLNVDLVENKIGAKTVFDPEKVIIVMDHQVPADSPATAEIIRIAQGFAERMHLPHFYKSDGICHQLLFERHVEPGMLIVGADSHTNSHGVLGAFSCGMGSTDIAAAMVSGETWLIVPETVRFDFRGTLAPGVFPKDLVLALIKRTTCSGLVYKAVEFGGDGLRSIAVPDRFTLCNMTTEMGAKSSMIPPDEATWDHLTTSRAREITRDPALFSDPDATYCERHDVDLDGLEPQVACPHSVDNVHDIGAVRGQRIDQAFVGACTNGRIEDLRIAAGILNGRKVAAGVRLLVTPASRSVYSQAVREGLVETFLDAGAILSHPGCSACWGACQGVLASNERMISSGNRNFRGRAGASDSAIFLASPATVAASAIQGYITDPREHLS